MRISKHISYKEAVKSQTATRLDIDNNPDREQLLCMENVAEHVFEPIREHFHVPIVINSFFRSEELNRRIGGAASSQHVKGEALDIDDTMGKVTNMEMFSWIKDNLMFDQLLWEFGDDDNPAWVHVSLKIGADQRQQVLRVRRDNGKTYYDKWLG